MRIDKQQYFVFYVSEMFRELYTVCNVSRILLHGVESENQGALLPDERRWGCLSSFQRAYRESASGYAMRGHSASAAPDLRIPAQPHSVDALWLAPE